MTENFSSSSRTSLCFSRTGSLHLRHTVLFNLIPQNNRLLIRSPLPSRRLVITHRAVGWFNIPSSTHSTVSVAAYVICSSIPKPNAPVRHLRLLWSHYTICDDNSRKIKGPYGSHIEKHVNSGWDANLEAVRACSFALPVFPVHIYHDGGTLVHFVIILCPPAHDGARPQLTPKLGSVFFTDWCKKNLASISSLLSCFPNTWIRCGLGRNRDNLSIVAWISIHLIQLDQTGGERDSLDHGTLDMVALQHRHTGQHGLVLAPRLVSDDIREPSNLITTLVRESICTK